MLRKLFQTFFDACACSCLVADYKTLSKTEGSYSDYSALKASHIRTSYQMLFQQLNMDKRCESLVDDVIKSAELLSVSATGLILAFTIAQSENGTEKDVLPKVELQLQLEETLCKQFYTYLTELEKERNSLIFENYTLDELQAIYRQKELYQAKAQK